MAMQPTADGRTGVTRASRDIAERFVQLVSRLDLEGTVALYAPDAIWDVHLPTWDTVITGQDQIRPLIDDFFFYDELRIPDWTVVANGEDAAVRWRLTWRDRNDGARCWAEQSQFFTIRDGTIRHHWMHCSGVRSDRPSQE